MLVCPRTTIRANFNNNKKKNFVKKILNDQMFKVIKNNSTDYSFLLILFIIDCASWSIGVDVTNSLLSRLFNTIVVGFTTSTISRFSTLSSRVLLTFVFLNYEQPMHIVMNFIIDLKNIMMMIAMMMKPKPMLIIPTDL